MNGKTTFYTDGACLDNGSTNASGGIGIYHPKTSLKVSVPWGGMLEEHYGPPTNNKCELWAVAMTIRLAESHNEPVVEIFSDSTYVVDGINTRMDQWKARGWKLANKKPVANLEMWKEISSILSETDKKVKMTHVKGHDGNPGNEVADELAESAARIRRGGQE